LFKFVEIFFMGKVIGIGGIFLKFKDPKAMRKWYKEQLGIEPNDYGVLFSYNGNSSPRAYLQLGTFENDSDYFGVAQQQCMINFRVDNLTSLLEKLKSSGVTIVDEIETYEYGKFLHIEDPEGNRIELWEPIDSPFDQDIINPMR
jgi:predicted enzyme related to lactoylglutathione lyase